MGGFKVSDWKCYTTTDMVNWTDLGTIASVSAFPWAVQDNAHGHPKQSNATQVLSLRLDHRKGMAQ